MRERSLICQSVSRSLRGILLRLRGLKFLGWMCVVYWLFKALKSTFQVDAFTPRAIGLPVLYPLWIDWTVLNTPQLIGVGHHFCVKHLCKCLVFSFDFLIFRIIIYSPLETQNWYIAMKVLGCLSSNVANFCKLVCFLSSGKHYF